MSYPVWTAGAINSLFFGVYGVALDKLEKIDAETSKSQGKEINNTYRNIFIAGCVGGIPQLLVATPVDLVKIKLQIQTGTVFKTTVLEHLLKFMWVQ